MDVYSSDACLQLTVYLYIIDILNAHSRSAMHTVFSGLVSVEQLNGSMYFPYNDCVLVKTYLLFPLFISLFTDICRGHCCYAKYSVTIGIASV